MSPDHWSKLTWDTVSAGGYDLFGPIGYLDRIRDRACKQRSCFKSVFAILFLIFVDASFSFWELTMNTVQSWHAVEPCLRDFHA